MRKSPRISSLSPPNAEGVIPNAAARDLLALAVLYLFVRVRAKNPEQLGLVSKRGTGTQEGIEKRWLLLK